MDDACEYCDRGDVTLYAWHADVWCARCIEVDGGGMAMTGSLALAPIGRPAMSSYEQPFVWQTTDRTVVRGEIRAVP